MPTTFRGWRILLKEFMAVITAHLGRSSYFGRYIFCLFIMADIAGRFFGHGVARQSAAVQMVWRFIGMAGFTELIFP
jgi:hypothetical protein